MCWGHPGVAAPRAGWNPTFSSWAGASRPWVQTEILEDSLLTLGTAQVQLRLLPAQFIPQGAQGSSWQVRDRNEHKTKSRLPN